VLSDDEVLVHKGYSFLVVMKSCWMIDYDATNENQIQIFTLPKKKTLLCFEFQGHKIDEEANLTYIFSDLFIVKQLIRLMEIFKNLSSSLYSCTLKEPQ
jgi:hypothetical protein